MYVSIIYTYSILYILYIHTILRNRSGKYLLFLRHDSTTADSFELSYPRSSHQHPPYHEEHQSIAINQSHLTHHQDDTMLHPMQPLQQ